MFSITSQNGKPVYGVVEIAVDAVADLGTIDTQLFKMGSSAIVLATGDIYILNGQRQWVQVSCSCSGSGSGSGGSGGGDDTPGGQTTIKKEIKLGYYNGDFTSIDDIVDSLTTQEVTKASLLSKGLSVNVTTSNQGTVLLIPKDLGVTCEGISAGGFSIEFSVAENSNYYCYYDTVSTGSYKYTYAFEEV